MTDELFRPLHGSPLWALIRRRLSGRVDTAIVFETDRPSDFRVRRPRRDVGSHTDRMPLGAILARGYAHAHEVDLQSRTDSVTVAGEDLPEPVRVTLLWHVHDPVAVVRASLRGDEDVAPAIRNEVAGRVRSGARDHDVTRVDELASRLREELTRSYELADRGITYRIGYIGEIPPETPTPRDHGGLSYWDPARRPEFDFCKAAVREGHVSLLALWLMREPGKVKEILDWTLQHPLVEEPSSTLDGELVTLLTEADKTERNQVRRAVGHALGRCGTDEAEALLRRYGLTDAPSANGQGGSLPDEEHR